MGFLVALGRQAIRVQDKRRTVNVIWDVMSFWPRSAHPFVPAPYSQFAVAALRDRIRFYRGDGAEEPAKGTAKHVLVCAHSQGTLIAFAALLRLRLDELENVSFLTYGSQLQVAFPRAFPAYVEWQRFENLADSLGGGWINLFRDTDPIGGPVFSWDHSVDSNEAGDLMSRRLESPDVRCADNVPSAHTGRRECGRDWRILDPSPADRDLQTGHLSAMMKHSHYPVQLTGTMLSGS